MAVKTYAATSWICFADSLSLKAGIGPPPFSTCVTTRASGGFSWSRFGPTLPVAPASFSVWQPEQPEAPVKIALPAVGSPFDDGAEGVVCAAVVVAWVSPGGLRLLPAEDQHRGEHRDEEQRRHREVEAHEAAGEIRDPARQDERRDEREHDERRSDGGQADLVTGRQGGDDEREHRGETLPKDG